MSRLISDWDNARMIDIKMIHVLQFKLVKTKEQWDSETETKNNVGTSQKRGKRIDIYTMPID